MDAREQQIVRAAEYQIQLGKSYAEQVTYLRAIHDVDDPDTFIDAAIDLMAEGLAAKASDLPHETPLAEISSIARNQDTVDIRTSMRFTTAGGIVKEFPLVIPGVSGTITIGEIEEQIWRAVREAKPGYRDESLRGIVKWEIDKLVEAVL